MLHPIESLKLKVNLLPRSVVAEAEGEIWPNPIWTRAHLTGMWQAMKERKLEMNSQNGGRIKQQIW